jgi:metaxin
MVVYPADELRLQGLPSQEAYDKALAIAQLVLGRLLPAYLISLPRRPSNIHLCLPIPPMLSAGLTTPLPASLTGDARNVDKEDILKKGVEALDALETLLGSSDWALGAS